MGYLLSATLITFQTTSILTQKEKGNRNPNKKKKKGFYKGYENQHSYKQFDFVCTHTRK